MTKRSYIQIDGVLYEKGTEPLSDAHHVMPDIQPYRSMVDGSMITSRSQHREHLRRHGCVEVGDQALPIANQAFKNSADVAPQHRREIIRAQVDAMRHDEFRRALKRDIDRVKWNSRGLPRVQGD